MNMQAAGSALHAVPGGCDAAALLALTLQAMRDLLNWLSQRYNASIIITENGVSAPG